MKTILHVIDSLKTGGAEVLLTGIVNSMNEYDHVIVTLLPVNDFEDILSDHTIYHLNYKNKLSIPSAVRKLRSIIKAHNVYIIHSHLVTATFLTRLAKPSDIPLFFSVHSILSKDAFRFSKLSYLLEKLTYKKSDLPIFVSKESKLDYDQMVGLKGRSFVLPNFIGNEFFQNKWSKKVIEPGSPLKLVCVGTLKESKNYKFLIDTLSQLRIDFILDIYGSGPQHGLLKQMIIDGGLEQKIVLKGNSQIIFQVLSRYDIFLMASTYEGFGIAILEAMAIGVPTLVSDIDIFKEIGKDCLTYFELNNSEDLIKQLTEMLKDPDKLNVKSNEGREIAMKLSTKDNFLKKLRSLYQLSW